MDQHLARGLWLLVFLSALFPGTAGAADAPRNKVRLLCGFEGAEAAQLTKAGENVELITVNDNGVTEGKNCARLTIPKGADYGVLNLAADMIRDWGDFDYFAVDVFTEDEHRYPIVLELWDDLSKNYPTRCTFEGVAQTRPGRQTLLFPINRAKRNGKEGRDWEELQPQDKIKMNGLTRVKLFANPLKDRDAVFWIDNIRLMQEDAAKPKFKIDLPAGAVAFKFGSAGSTVPGFRQIVPGALSHRESPGFVAPPDLVAGGEGWPDLLTGTFITNPKDDVFEFRAPVPNGEYRVWLAAGPVVRPGTASPLFRLRVNDVVLHDERPSREDFLGPKYLYRFLNTQYSEKPHALWNNYIDRMYPIHTAAIKVADGLLSIQTANHFLSAVVLVPAADKEGFDQFAATAKTKRIEAFEATYFTPKHAKPKPVGDEPFVVYAPEVGTTVRPWTGPTLAESKRTGLRTAVARGQRVVLRLAVTPFADLGKCSLTLADLTGPGVISAKQVQGHFQNYRSDGGDVNEMVLLPSLTPTIEAGVSQCFWLWLTVPDDTAAGIYKGSYTFKPGVSKAIDVPVELEVYPFALESVLPVSYGMYYGPPTQPPFPEADRRRLLKEQLTWMRQIGFTAAVVGGPQVTSVDRKAGKVQLKFDPTMYDLAREVGMGRDPNQLMMAQSLGVARSIGRQLLGDGAKVDQQPGVELRQPGFKECYLDAMRQYRAAIEKTGVPTAVEIVDEPRETPNPWNRNLADSIVYGDLLKEAGLRSFITPMGDGNNGKDYTALIDHCDILSTHAWKGSAGLIRKTRAAKKTLWLYNTGMDRFSWGFYAARVGAVGRWEWHFCFAEDTAKGGYPGREWYNPFTGLHGLAPQAPTTYPGGMLYQSAYLDVAEGVNDYAYLYTLRQAIAAHQKAGTNEKTVAEAVAFLEALDRVIPELPELKGVVHEGDGALVGMGVQDEARLQVDEWRRKAAGYLRILKK